MTSTSFLPSITVTNLLLQVAPPTQLLSRARLLRKRPDNTICAADVQPVARAARGVLRLAVYMLSPARRVQPLAEMSFELERCGQAESVSRAPSQTRQHRFSYRVRMPARAAFILPVAGASAGLPFDRRWPFNGRGALPTGARS